MSAPPAVARLSRPLNLSMALQRGRGGGRREWKREKMEAKKTRKESKGDEKGGKGDRR